MAAERRTFRALGGVDGGSAVPGPSAAVAALEAEFERVFALKERLKGEAAAPVSPTGRRTTADAEAKLRTLVASVEGASRFAIRLGLLDPGQVRAIWAGAIGRGLYEGWDGGQSAYAHAVGGVAGAPRLPGSAPKQRAASDPLSGDPLGGGALGGGAVGGGAPGGVSSGGAPGGGAPGGGVPGGGAQGGTGPGAR